MRDHEIEQLRLDALVLDRAAAIISAILLGHSQDRTSDLRLGQIAKLREEIVPIIIDERHHYSQFYALF